MKGNKGRPYSVPEEITRYYERGLEATRFSQAAGDLEFIRTQEIIARRLPPPPAVVLDIGGGPGTYALWLATEGFEVHLPSTMGVTGHIAAVAVKRG